MSLNTDVNDDNAVPVRTCTELHPVFHGFTMRAGGVSVAPRDSLCLALRSGGQADAVCENWRRVLGARVQSLVLLDQVHGAEVLVATDATGPLKTLGEADAVVTDRPGLVLAVRTADCVPVLFTAKAGGRVLAVGAAHAGWRGVAAGVVPATVRALRTLAPGGRVQAAIGPHASVQAYETGPEVIDALVASGSRRSRVCHVPDGGREHANLRLALVDQLEALGVSAIAHVMDCTIRDRRYFSHRRDGAATGRQAGFIGLAA